MGGIGHTADRRDRKDTGHILPCTASTRWGRAKIIKGIRPDGEVCGSRESAVNIRQVLTYAIIAFIIWWIVQQPANAAHLIHNIAGLLTTAAKGMSNFLASI